MGSVGCFGQIENIRRQSLIKITHKHTKIMIVSEGYKSAVLTYNKLTNSNNGRTFVSKMIADGDVHRQIRRHGRVRR